MRERGGAVLPKALAVSALLAGGFLLPAEMAGAPDAVPVPYVDPRVGEGVAGGEGAGHRPAPPARWVPA